MHWSVITHLCHGLRVHSVATVQAVRDAEEALTAHWATNDQSITAELSRHSDFDARLEARTLPGIVDTPQSTLWSSSYCKHYCR